MPQLHSHRMHALDFHSACLEVALAVIAFSHRQGALPAMLAKFGFVPARQGSPVYFANGANQAVYRLGLP